MSRVEFFDKMLSCFKLWIFQNHFFPPESIRIDFLHTVIPSPTTREFQGPVHNQRHLCACRLIGSGIFGFSIFMKLLSVVSFMFIRINKELWILTGLKLQICFQKLLYYFLGFAPVNTMDIFTTAARCQIKMRESMSKSQFKHIILYTVWV